MTSGDDLFKSAPDQVSEEEQWISLSDLMASLMMIFMLLAIAYMVKQEAQSFKVKQVATVYEEIRTELYEELTREFSKDLPVWDAEITPDLAFRFRNPDILFDTGKDVLKPKFQTILDDFFPRYVKIITNPKYEGTISEIRIEGHTSSKWLTSASAEEAYFLNMELSQSRTRSTLRYVMGLPQVSSKLGWLKQYVTANGLSSSRLILNKDGAEDIGRSQRVEFHIRTDAEAWLKNIRDEVR